MSHEERQHLSPHASRLLRGAVIGLVSLLAVLCCAVFAWRQASRACVRRLLGADDEGWIQVELQTRALLRLVEDPGERPEFRREAADHLRGAVQGRREVARRIEAGAFDPFDGSERGDLGILDRLVAAVGLSRADERVLLEYQVDCLRRLGLHDLRSDGAVEAWWAARVQPALVAIDRGQPVAVDPGDRAARSFGAAVNAKVAEIEGADGTVYLPSKLPRGTLLAN